jgi:hypothetical protein
MEQLIKRPELLKKICSYAGWNTTGNTTGSALGTAICTIAGMAINNKSVSDSQKRSLLLGWLTTGLIRQKFAKNYKNEPSTQKLAELISPYIKTVSAALGL